MVNSTFSVLSPVEARLRPLLPSELSEALWPEPNRSTLTRTYEHLRTLRRMLHDYVPRQVSERPPQPGQIRYEWQEGTLMFTDLAGFTRLTEAHAVRGRSGAEALLKMLNAYFAGIIEIISKAGGDLLEFTGDALLVQFPPSPKLNHTVQAIRAGLRMQRAMQRFAQIDTDQGTYSLQMRVGLHCGRFLTADIGTAMRMEHILMGSAVQIAKQAEGSGAVGKVCLTRAAQQRVEGEFRFVSGKPGYSFVVDDLSDEYLGEYDIVPPTRRMAANVLWDRSIESLAEEITKEVNHIEPLASYLPASTLHLVVESTTQRQIPPDFPSITVVFVNLLGLAEMVDQASVGEEREVVSSFSQVTALMNTAVEKRGGVLKKVTYHLTGSDLMLLFGIPEPHEDDSLRAADTALAVQEIVNNLPPISVGGKPIKVDCQLGIARGAVFAAEVGEPHGRREFNILGDPVNTAARLMNLARYNQILLTGGVYNEIAHHFECESFGAVSLRGKMIPIQVFGLRGKR